MKAIDRDTVVLAVGAVLMAVLAAHYVVPYMELTPALQNLF